MEAVNLFQILASLAIGYLAGSLNGAQVIHHVIPRYRKIHPTEIGTKIAGTQNVWMNVGRLPALLVLAIDISKGYFAVWTAGILGLQPPISFIGGMGAILGHNWPVYFHFKGGRGVASLAGALLALEPKTALIAILLSAPFTIIRWSGLMPLVMILIVSAIHPLHGPHLTSMMLVVIFIILLNRISAYWTDLAKSDNKLLVLKNVIWYDRPGANPPSLGEMFGFKARGNKSARA